MADQLDLLQLHAGLAGPRDRHGPGWERQYSRRGAAGDEQHGCAVFELAQSSPSKVSHTLACRNRAPVGST
jgi:hypothetical protein